jgi:hypothetical protein
VGGSIDEEGLEKFKASVYQFIEKALTAIRAEASKVKGFAYNFEKPQKLDTTNKSSPPTLLFAYSELMGCMATASSLGKFSTPDRMVYELLQRGLRVMVHIQIALALSDASYCDPGEKGAFKVLIRDYNDYMKVIAEFGELKETESTPEAKLIIDIMKVLSDSERTTAVTQAVINKCKEAIKKSPHRFSGLQPDVVSLPDPVKDMISAAQVVGQVSGANKNM